MAERAREPSHYLAERHVLYSNIMAVSTAGSTRPGISGISAKTAKTCMAITSKASSNTGIGISTNSIANNGITDTAFGLSSLSLRSEREEREGALSWQHTIKIKPKCRSGAVLGPFGPRHRRLRSSVVINLPAEHTNSFDSTAKQLCEFFLERLIPSVKYQYKHRQS